MEADCAYKIPRRPLCGTTECKTGLFRQKARKTPFYKHYLHYKFLKLYELLMFLDFLVTFRYLETRYLCILSKTFSTINHTFSDFTC